MFLSEHRLTFEEWIKENSHLLIEDRNEDELKKLYEEYTKQFE